MLRVLITNDDGISSPGLRTLEEAFADVGEVWVVAPECESSACGRSVTLHRPLRVKEIAKRRFAIDGTPSDCVLLAFRRLVPERPDIVISGINRGNNIGEDLDYSGTIGAAAEGALQGARIALAASADEGIRMEDLPWAAGVVRTLTRRLLHHLTPTGTYLNVNLPRQPTTQVRWTRPAHFLGTGQVDQCDDPRGRTYYWISARPQDNHPPADTDRGALADGIISLTLLTLARTHEGEWERPDFSKDGLGEVCA
jgi:5'/3'-nucleotidase